MKKNFFKKLSFVMALAMTVSVVAPAASAFAATAPKLTATTKYLYVNETGKASEYDFGIKNLVKGSKVAFVSDNEEVATVDKATGLTTAVSRGTAHVSAKITLKTKKTVTLKATVYVRDYIKTVDIKEPGTKYVVGSEYDFNRDFTNNGGSKTTSSICRWSVDKTGATVDATTGKITFTEVGTFKVTVDSFNSAADYESYKTSKDATLVKATDTVSVTVVPTLAVVQKDVDTITLSFNAAMTDVAKNLSIYTVIGTTEVLVTSAKPVSMSADKKTATVDFYVPLTEKATYIVKYTGVDPVNFVAASTEIEKVARVTVKTTEAVISTPTKIEVQLWDANGVDITTTKLVNRVTFSKSSDKVWLDPSTNELLIYTKGVTTNVDAVFHTYKYEGGKEVGTVSGTGTVIGVDAYPQVVGTLKAWTAVSTEAVSFTDVKQAITVKDNRKLIVQLNTSTNGKEGTITNQPMGKFEFKSSDPAILFIDKDGVLYPQKTGTVAIVIVYDGKSVDVINVTVGAEKAAATLVLDKTDVTMSNNLSETVFVGAKVKDQYNNDLTLDTSKLKVEQLSGSASTTIIGTASGAGVKFVTSNSPATTKGAYYFKVTYGDNIPAWITVNVGNTSVVTPSAYTLELSAITVDNKSTSTNLRPTLGIRFASYAEGVKLNQLALSSASFSVTVTGPDDFKYVMDNTDLETFKLTTGSGTNIIPLKDGTYTVTAKNASGVSVDIKYFEIKNTQVHPTFVVKNTAYTAGNDKDQIAKECFTLTFNGKEIVSTDASYATIMMDEYLGTLGGNIYVKTIKYTETIGSDTLVHYITVNQDLTVK